MIYKKALLILILNLNFQSLHPMNYNDIEQSQNTPQKIIKLQPIRLQPIQSFQGMQRTPSQDSFYSDGTGGGGGQRYENYAEYRAAQYNKELISCCCGCCVASSLLTAFGYAIYEVLTFKND